MPVISLLCLIGACDYLVTSAGVSASFDDVEAVPACDVAVVLGTARKVSRRQFNLHYQYRIKAAVELFKAGKASYMLVSGDNSTVRYNEPRLMKKDLIKEGVPKERIYCDYAGFRTLDSIVRAKEVFGLKRFIVVSQKYHNERAIYIARNYGIDVYGFNARDVGVFDDFTTVVRERFARVKCILDLKVLKSSPKFLGEPIRIGFPLHLLNHEEEKGKDEICFQLQRFSSVFSG